MFKKKNYKLLLGLIVGVIISSGLVYATGYAGTASEISYDNSKSGLYASDVQDALDELYIRKDCPKKHGCYKIKNTLELGDYVYYEPEKTSATTDTSKTGYSEVQTIIPNELKLWRVLFINEDGTVDLVSEDISSTDICFSGQLGYQNLVGYLNVLASKYETEGITVGSRHFGYDGQTEYITDTSMFTNPAPWACSTGGSCTPAPVESQGGGDKLYERDYNQARTLFKTAAAFVVGTNDLEFYWIASRIYMLSDYYNYRSGRLINTGGSVVSNSNMYSFDDIGLKEGNQCTALRPVIILSQKIQVNGVGTRDNPMKIITD